MAERPLCKCHNEPMHVQGFKANGDRKWQCAVKHKEQYNRRYREEPGFAQRRRVELYAKYHFGGGREAKRERYLELKSKGLCVKCAKPSLTEALCWDCLSYMEEHRAVNI